MPAPIIPAPSTPTLVACQRSMPSGRSEPELIAWRSKKKAWIMFLSLLVDDQVGEVAGLDPRGGVEVDLRALDRGGQDRARRGVDRALGLLAQQRREGGQERRQLGVLGVPPGIL